MTSESNLICCKCTSINKSAEKPTNSSAEDGKIEVEVDKTNNESKAVKPTTKTVFKKFMSKVSCQETMEKVEIKIELHGHKFNAENLDVQVVNDNVLIVKAEDDKEKFERNSIFLPTFWQKKLNQNLM